MIDFETPAYVVARYNEKLKKWVAIDKFLRQGSTASRLASTDESLKAIRYVDGVARGILAAVTWCLLVSLSFGQISLQDHGAIPGDGVDDSQAYLAAAQEAQASGKFVYLDGDYELKPTRMFVTGDLVVVSPHPTVGRFSRMENRSWTVRYSCAEGSSLRFLRCGFNGNGDQFAPVQGDDQHHEVRIDALNGSSMDLVEFVDCESENLVADGVQMVHNGLDLLLVKGWKNRFVHRERRTFQLSYHPKAMICSDSDFRTFSTEPSGGTQNAVNLQLSNCRIGTANLHSMGEVTITNCRIGRLSRLSFEGGVVSTSTFDEVADSTFYGPVRGLVTDCEFRLNIPLSLRARFTRHAMDLQIDNCRFIPHEPMTTVFISTYPQTSNFPEAKIRFSNCKFPGQIVLSNGYDWEVVNCEFNNGGILANAIFGQGGSLRTKGNRYRTASCVTTQASSIDSRNHIFKLYLEQPEIDNSARWNRWFRVHRSDAVQDVDITDDVVEDPVPEEAPTLAPVLSRANMHPKFFTKASTHKKGCN